MHTSAWEQVKDRIGTEFPTFRTPTKIKIGVAIGILAAGAIIAAYLFSPAAHGWIQNHCISPLDNHSMTLGQNLLAVSLPIASISAAVHVYLRYQHSRDLKQISPAHKQAKIEGMLGMKPTPIKAEKMCPASLACDVIAAIAVFSILIPLVSQIFHPIGHALNTKMNIAHALLYCEMPVLTLATLVHGVATYYRKKEQTEALFAYHQNCTGDL